jgi:nickel-dependent lactate racemase
LIGTMMAAGPSPAQDAPAATGSRNSVVIPTHEFAGNIDERLDFPADWQIDVIEMAGHNASELTDQQIAAALAQPVGTKTLRELAAGKQRVVITFDDLTRPTPTYAVAPWVLAELKAAGVADENILFLTSYGTHRPMSELDIPKKLGPEIARRYAFMNHNCWDNLKDLGETSYKTPVRINQTFMAGDLKICISGIKVHAQAGYGGGAKAILPGVAAMSTIEHNHLVVLPNSKTGGEVRVFKNDMRLDMIETARLAQVDFTVQVVYNQRLRPTAVFSGDIVDAHHAAVRVANQHYRTPTFKNADIVVANGYPQCCQAGHSQAWIDRSIKESGTGVLVLQQPSILDPFHYLDNHTGLMGGKSYFDLAAQHLNRTPSGPGNTALIVYSRYANRTLMNYYPRTTRFCDKWADVLNILQQRHKGSVQVAVYPYAAIQHVEMDLDG